MQFKSISITLIASAALASAVVVDLFHDTDCRDPAGNRNVFDDSCATLEGFSSFRITTPAGVANQVVSAFSRNACAGPVTACTPAVVTGDCIRATNDAGYEETLVAPKLFGQLPSRNNSQMISSLVYALVVDYMFPKLAGVGDRGRENDPSRVKLRMHGFRAGSGGPRLAPNGHLDRDSVVFPSSKARWCTSEIPENARAEQNSSSPSPSSSLSLPSTLTVFGGDIVDMDSRTQV
ncbi:hypothetical protein NMY22_g6810 [Coprinellus aureogranulatus]|nr:hypothetical protein NMY22_g6810 [Coprinellus aureogranulatus]